MSLFRSSGRRLYQRLSVNESFRVITPGLLPDFKTMTRPALHQATRELAFRVSHVGSPENADPILVELCGVLEPSDFMPDVSLLASIARVCHLNGSPAAASTLLSHVIRHLYILDSAGGIQGHIRKASYDVASDLALALALNVLRGRHVPPRILWRALALLSPHASSAFGPDAVSLADFLRSVTSPLVTDRDGSAFVVHPPPPSRARDSAVAGATGGQSDELTAVPDPPTAAAMAAARHIADAHAHLATAALPLSPWAAQPPTAATSDAIACVMLAADAATATALSDDPTASVVGHTVPLAVAAAVVAASGALPPVHRPRWLAACLATGMIDAAASSGRTAPPDATEVWAAYSATRHVALPGAVAVAAAEGVAGCVDAALACRVADAALVLVGDDLRTRGPTGEALVSRLLALRDALAAGDDAVSV